jgi:hypothetical protein
MPDPSDLRPLSPAWAFRSENSGKSIANRVRLPPACALEWGVPTYDFPVRLEDALNRLPPRAQEAVEEQTAGRLLIAAPFDALSAAHN